jgi:hypothetical protein
MNTYSQNEKRKAKKQLQFVQSLPILLIWVQAAIMIWSKKVAEKARKELLTILYVAYLGSIL